MPAIAGSAAAARRDAAVELRATVRPDRDIAAIAAGDGIGLDRGASVDRGRVRALLAAATEEIAADQRRAAANITRHINRAACRQLDRAAEDLHATPACTAAATGSIKRAAIGRGAGTARCQHNRAVDILHAARLNDARVIDHAGQHRIPGASRKPYRATVGLDEAAIFGQVVQGALLDLQIDQAIAGKRQRDVAARAQRHRTRCSINAALITDRIADKGNIAAMGRIDRALVDDAARAAAAEMAHRAVHTGITDIKRGGNQASHVDVRSCTKQHAIRIDQVNLAVGIELAKELGPIRVADTVHCNGAGRRLDEIDGLLAAGVERRPIQ